MLKFYAVLSLVLLVASSAAAQEIDCVNPQVQLEMTFCAERDWKIADADLNAAYKAAQAEMKAIDADLPEAEKGAATSLRDGQRAWIEYRDAGCAAEGYLSHGGSIEPMVVAYCLARVTKTRAEEIWMLSQKGE
jgi:uncharacterized protein YecT (DUF1311 family)